MSSFEHEVSRVASMIPVKRIVRVAATQMACDSALDSNEVMLFIIYITH